MTKPIALIEKLTRWVGSAQSLMLHTLGFAIAFLFGVLHLSDWDTVLLVLTTVVSLEAIYLAIFIQMSVNQNTESLREVEVDVDEIQKDIDDIQSVDTVEAQRDARHHQALMSISERLQQLMDDVKQLDR